MGIRTSGGGGGISTETLIDETFTMDGTELTVFDRDVPNLEINGRVDLDNMDSGDKIVMRTYINGIKNAVSTYEDALLQSQIVITPIVFGEGDSWKLTLEQVSGTNRDVPVKVVSRG